MLTGVSHIHSTHSYDGELTLSEIRDLLKKDGVQFALISEHTNGLTKEAGERAIAECRAQSDAEILFIPGFEVPYESAHVLCLGVEHYPSTAEGIEMIRAFKKQRAMIVLAHPHRNNFEITSDLEALLDGTEVWNSQYDGKYAPRSASLGFLAALRKKKQIFAFCGQDIHRVTHVGGPCLFVDASNADTNNILDTIKKQAFSFGKKSGMQVSDSGNLVRGTEAQVALMSSVSVSLTVLGRGVLCGLRTLHIKPPKKLKQTIRKWI